MRYLLITLIFTAKAASAEPAAEPGTPNASAAVLPFPGARLVKVNAPRIVTADPVWASAPAEPKPASAADAGAPLPPGEEQRMARRYVGAGGISFTPGDGLMIESEDRDFSVGLGFRFQLLYTLLEPGPSNGNMDQSLQVRRARAQLAGHAFGPHNQYRLELAISPSDVDMTSQGVGTSPLLEAYTEFDYLRDLTVRAGQFKVPFDRMRAISDMARQLVDYSGATSEFSLDRDIGLELRSRDLFGAGFLRYYAAVMSGKGRNSFTATDMGLMYLGRVEVLPLGMFDDYSEGDFERTLSRVSVGGSLARIIDARLDRGTVGAAPLDRGGTTNLTLAEVDVVFKLRGFSALAGFYYRSGDRNSGQLIDATGKPILDSSGKALTAPSATRDGTALVVQAGYLLPYTDFELAARYSGIRGSSDPGHDALTASIDSHKNGNELGGGLNYYFAQHNLKLQTDYFRFYTGNLSNGYNQVRLQLQLVM